MVRALLPVAAGFFLIALDPRLWPGALAYLAAWAWLRRWRTELAWGAPLFTLYLFWGQRLEPAAFDELIGRARLALPLALGLLAWAWSTSLAARESRAAPLPLFAWALALGPRGAVLGWGVLAWVYWNFQVQRWGYAKRGATFRLDRRALASVALVALALAGLATVSVAIPFQGLPSGAAPVAGGPPPPGTAFAGAPAGGSAARAPRQVAPLPAWVDALGYYGTVLAGVLSLLLMGILLRVFWIMLRVPGERPRLSRRAVFLAVLVVFAVLFWIVGYGLLFRGEGTVGPSPLPPLPTAPGADVGGGGASPAAPGSALVWPGRAVGVVWGLGVLMLVLLSLVLGYLLVRMLRRREEETALALEEASVSGAPSAQHAGRVRAVYQAFLQRMRPRIAKLQSETPQEYARRVAAHFPRLADAVWGMTQLYEPVRYGGLADDQEAEQAEAWLVRLETELENEEVR